MLADIVYRLEKIEERGEDKYSNTSMLRDL